MQNIMDFARLDQNLLDSTVPNQNLLDLIAANPISRHNWCFRLLAQL
jgi:hypothetical protein